MVDYFVFVIDDEGFGWCGYVLVDGGVVVWIGGDGVEGIVMVV